METETQKQKTDRKNGRGSAYVALVFVILIWGTSPIVNAYLYNSYTATICTAVASFVSGLSLLVICLPHLKKLNKTYFKIAVPTGIFNSVASLLQKIGLQYTTPAQYAFLENLSCVVVPVLLFIFIKKKSGVLTISASILCLVGSFILSGMSFTGNHIALGKGELLCALAGLCYGVNIAATGAFGKKLFAPLYVLIQTWIHTVISFATAIALNVITVNGAPIEAIKFSWDLRLLLVIVALALISNTLCWIIRTNVMKRINASVVAVLMPFSAVVAGVVSVLCGMDTWSVNLILGASISLVAAIMSGFGDLQDNKKAEKESNT